MRVPFEISSAPERHPENEHNVAVDSGSETDRSFVAWIRQVYGTLRLSADPEGTGEGDGGKNDSANRIGKFEVLGEIGRGTYGTVLLVHDPDLRRERALKVPNPETLDSPGALARFIDEARFASRIDHPNVVRIYEAETLGILPFIVMEYCSGGSLGQWLAARAKPDRLPERWVAKLVAGIAEGVEQAHRAGLLHRDIKPGNILLESIGEEDNQIYPSFRPKIADFGLAKVFTQDGIGRSTASTGNPLGTWAYMSPEQARGEKRILATTDVYAMGAILYELLTRERLYTGLGQTEILSRLVSPDPTPSPRAIRKDLHRDLETICLKCLEKRPSDRYQNSSELSNELHRFIDGMPILARRASIWRRGLLRIKRQPVRSALASVAAISIVAGLFAWLQFRDLRRRGEVDVLLNNLESAPPARFPELIPRIAPSDPRVISRLGSLFIVGTPPQRLASALVLAKSQRDYLTYSYDQLLLAEPHDISPVAQVLSEKMPDLSLRLAMDADIPSRPAKSDADAELHDRRRANAACALIHLDRGDLGWRLLRFTPDPQARSFLIHLIGPAGVAPRLVLDRLDAEPDPTIRRALVQCLGETPEKLWLANVKDRARFRLLNLYENDPDSGVHGSCKWVLMKWGLRSSLLDIDGKPLSRQSRRSWRATPNGLTLVTVQGLKGGRIIEVADSETNNRLFAKFFPNHKSPPQVSPSPDHPVTNINYILAADFCNRLSTDEGIGADDLAFRKGLGVALEPAENYLDRTGYRLLTIEEHEHVCRAGSHSIRYYGNSGSLLNEYALCGPLVSLTLLPSCTLKPNDLGLFDMLGNANEVSQGSPANGGPRNQAALCGGSLVQPGFSVRNDSKIERMSVAQVEALYSVGFRVARTRSPVKTR